jgi:hypothetical protein
MKKETKAGNHRGILLSLVIFGLVAALIILPNQFRSKAGSQIKAGKGLVPKTVSHDEKIDYYDIRLDKNADTIESLRKYRESSNKDASAVADVRENFVRGEESLRQKVPTLKINYNDDIQVPEVIAPDVWRGRHFLTAPSGAKHSEILRNFIKDNTNLIGVNTNQADSLKVTADYTNPDGNLSYAHLEQFINDIPVFRGEIKAGFTKNGEMFRIINNLAPGMEYGSLSTDFRDPLDAVKAAAGHINNDLGKLDLNLNNADSDNLRTVFGTGDWATTAEKMYFPTEPGVAVPAWRVLIWQPVNAYYVIVDAASGTMLWRKNITDDQTQPATYNVYANANSLIDVADSPAPITPGPIDPSIGTQGVQTGRVNRTLIGNEAPNQGMNNLGWITDGANITDGNNVEAGVDLGAPNGVDAPVMGTNRVFNFNYNPPPGMPAPPDPITSQASRDGGVTQLFYTVNRYHDVMYQFGFTEAARNFQNDNFGRGGAGADRVSAEAQDSSGTDNANFATPADGGRGRMQMYRFTQTPNRDGSLDTDIVVHEFTHGLSNRLIGNGTGVAGARGMGEGWSDWYAMALQSEPTDPINGIYSTGAYATFQAFGLGSTNTYYGIRRFPYAVRAFTGGANNRPHNPLTFGDLNTPCVINDGAFPAAFSGSCTEVHNAGEIWASLLWEVRARFITRLGGAAGNSKTIQLVTDGMKLSPTSGLNMQTARDAIIAAAQASAAAPEAGLDVVDVREGFRIRGMGFSASDNGTTAVEAFDTPNVVMSNPFAVSDSTGNNNGVPEPGESVLLSVAITNTTGATVNSVVANVNGGTNVSYGNIADGATVTMQIPFTIPANAPCGSTQMVTINISSASGAQTPQMRSFILGSPVGTVQNFDGVTVPALPAGWTTTQDVGTAITWATTNTGPSSAPNSAFANDPGTVNMSSLVSPNVPVSSTSAQLRFKNKYVTEASTTAGVGFDGMVLEISVGGGAFQDILASGGTFASGGYNATISSTFSSPIGGRMAWSGTSVGGYIDTVVNIPASANGQNVQFRWRMASDSSVTGTGVNVDDVQIVSSFNCAPVNPAPIKSRADFDGDGRTDLSVFRPSEGNWYLNRSTAGFSVINWGSMNDVLVPGDYDGDGKADTAVFRASNTVGTPDFLILNSMTNTISGVEWGVPNDVPVVADYDNDGKADAAVYRPSTGTWFILNSNGGTTTNTYGLAGDIPVVGDFVGDDAADLTVYRNGTWYTRLSGGGSAIRTFGVAGDTLVPADYDGDNNDDLAVFRSSEGRWYIYNSSTGMITSTLFGISSDVPVPGDYDGDGRDDLAVYRNGTWYVNGSTSGSSVSSFGVMSDRPIPKQYIP